jgi:alpha-glucosidase
MHDASGDLDRNGWHGTMNYPGFLRPVWSWLRSEKDPELDYFGAPGGIPRRGGVDIAATMRTFAAGMSWRSLSHSWTKLGSHDTARIRTVLGDADRVEVALGLQMAYPGVPMLFAGDEIGLEGVNGEDARRPMPWQRPQGWDTATLDRYRALIGLRRRTAALRHGGLRWAHVDDEALAFVRETADERLLVYARRDSGAPVALPGTGANGAENLYGGARMGMDADGSLLLPGDGPTVQVWRLS